MSYKTIMLCLSNEQQVETLTPVAAQVARQFSAHLTAVHAIPTIYNFTGGFVGMPIGTDEIILEAQRKHAKVVESAFNITLQREGINGEWRLLDDATLNIGYRLSEQARSADLVIMAQGDPENERVDQRDILREVIETSGRPVLVIPRHGSFETIGHRALIGWSTTRESARAVHDAIPFLRATKQADVFTVSKRHENKRMEHSTRDLAADLSRHDISVNVVHRTKGDLVIGDELLNMAADTSADLIVTGAYGHSRMYDFVVGATTPHLLEHMTVPVLFSC